MVDRFSQPEMAFGSICVKLAGISRVLRFLFPLKLGIAVIPSGMTHLPLSSILFVGRILNCVMAVINFLNLLYVCTRMSGKSFTRNVTFPEKYSKVHHKSIKDRNYSFEKLFRMPGNAANQPHCICSFKDS